MYQICSLLFFVSEFKSGTVDKGVLKHAEGEKILTQKRWTWRKLHNEKLHQWNFSPHITCCGYLAKPRAIRNAYVILIGKSE
jgi:hypothetical protein